MKQESEGKLDNGSKKMRGKRGGQNREEETKENEAGGKKGKRRGRR